MQIQHAGRQMYLATLGAAGMVANGGIALAEMAWAEARRLAPSVPMPDVPASHQGRAEADARGPRHGRGRRREHHQDRADDARRADARRGHHAHAPCRAPDPEGRRDAAGAPPRVVKAAPKAAKRGRAVAAKHIESVPEQVKATAEQIWLAGMGALTLARTEGSKMFETLVDLGKQVEKAIPSPARCGADGDQHRGGVVREHAGGRRLPGDVGPAARGHSDAGRGRAADQAHRAAHRGHRSAQGSQVTTRRTDGRRAASAPVTRNRHADDGCSRQLCSRRSRPGGRGPGGGDLRDRRPARARRGARRHRLQRAFPSTSGCRAGAFVAANLANRITTAQNVRAIVKHEPGEHPFVPQTFFTPAVGELLRRGVRTPSLLLDAALGPVCRTHDATSLYDSAMRLSRVAARSASSTTSPSASTSRRSTR